MTVREAIKLLGKLDQDAKLLMRVGSEMDDLVAFIKRGDNDYATVSASQLDVLINMKVSTYIVKVED